MRTINLTDYITEYVGKHNSKQILIHKNRKYT